MKTCPVCSRSYADDTYTFCLDDGALLTASYDPQSTLQIPAARDTNQQRTEILNVQPSHDHLHPPQPLVTTPLTQNRSGKTSKVMAVVIVFLTASVLLLGYLLWRNNQSASSVASTSDANVQANRAVNTPTPPPNNNVNANTGEGEKDKTTGSFEWLEGVWEGTGYQHTPKMSWSVRFTAEDDTYTIEYPSLRCTGKWSLVEAGESRAKFKETITRGLERCSSDGDITIEKISDDEVSYKYTLPVIGEVATAKLSKRAAP